jgi:hypothetical protein
MAFPESLEYIGIHAFTECEGLKEIVLPPALKYIGEGAFKDCPSLETVVLSRKTKIGCKAFEGFSGKFIHSD